MSEPAVPDPTDVPITDPRAIRALAHPTRLALLEVLGSEGPATATRCAELTGQSVASCSFHLRSLAKHGFVDPVAGSGREKPWRLRSMTQRLAGDRQDPEGAAAAAAFGEFFLGHELDRLRAWWARETGASAEDRPWYDASVLTGATAWLTLAELREVEAELIAVVHRHFLGRPAGPGGRADGSRPVRVFLGSSVGLGPLAPEGD